MLIFLNHTLICRINWKGLGGRVFLTQVWDCNQVEELVGLIVFYESNEDLYSGCVKMVAFISISKRHIVQPGSN